MKNPIFAIGLTGLLLSAGAGLYAQSYQGAVRGVVSDAQGAVVAAAKISLINEATGIPRTALTNASGEYNFNAVDPATYSVSAESPSFKKFERKHVIVGTAESLNVDVKMEVGSVSESVFVTEDVPLLESANASNGQVLDRQKLVDLPNLGRNPFLLSKLSTNVTPVGDPRFNRFQDQSGSSQISIAGGPVRGNNYTIDGVPITDSVNRAVIIPSIEATQEMKLQTGTYDAEMGRTGGGVFNAFLKSGSNQVHGAVFGQTRQTDWLANNFFYNRSGTPRTDTPFYTWGGAIGGPVWIPKVYNGKNKTFFWLSTESYRQKSPLSDQYALPTAAERNGDYSASSVTIYDPLSSRACSAADNCPAGVTTVRTPFAGNKIPSQLINPVGSAFLKLLPLPSFNASTGALNYNGSDTLGDRADEYTAKLDHQLFSWWNVNLSYLHYKSREPGGNTLGGSIVGASNGSPYLLYRKVDATQANSVFTVNPTTVITARFGFNRFPNRTNPINLGYNLASLGLPASYINSIQADYFPEFDFTSNSNGFSNVSPSQTAFYSRNWLGSVSKYIGRHSLKMGVDYRAIHTDFTNLSYAAGQFNFNGVFTQQYPSKPNGTGNDFADALLGYPSAGQINTTTKLYTHVNYYGFYFQDDFRISNKLTMNFGIRYEYESGVKEDNNHYVVGFDQKAASPLASAVPGLTGAVQYAGLNGAPTACCNPLTSKLGPRIGVAYQWDAKTTIRGGYGIFYAPVRFADDASLALGYTQNTPYVASNNGNATPANSLSNPFPNGILQPVGNSLGALAGVGTNFNYIDQNRTSGLVQQFSFDVQRELPYSVMFEVGYIGSRSKNLQTSSTGTGNYDINQVPMSQLGLASALSAGVANPFYGKTGATGIIGAATVTQAQLLRPFPQFGNIGILTNPAHAQYDSLIAKAQKRMTAGLTFLSTFTLAKNYDNEFASGNFFGSSSTAPQNAYNLNAEWGLAVNDTPLRWTNSATYQLPFGKGKKYVNSNMLADLLVGGWQVNATNVYQTGFPLTITQAQNLNSVIGTGVQRPNATGISPVVSGSVQSRLNGYINPLAFSQAPIYTFGNLARTIPYRGPGTKNWDASMFKDFKVKEFFTGEFRAEALNIFNTTQFKNPNTTFGSSSFGKISTQTNFPRLIQLGVRFFF